MFLCNKSCFWWIFGNSLVLIISGFQNCTDGLEKKSSCYSFSNTTSGRVQLVLIQLGKSETTVQGAPGHVRLALVIGSQCIDKLGRSDTTSCHV